MNTQSAEKGLFILGSTGSIGEQTLDVVRNLGSKYRVVGLSAQQNVEKLAQQAREFRPDFVVIGEETLLTDLKTRLQDLPTNVYAGSEALVEQVQKPEIHLVLTAVVGFAGLKPTLAAIKAGKDIALANKETLVVAGEQVMEAARMKGVHILPVDSEHSALFQCMVGEKTSEIDKLILTASGGPFRGKSLDELTNVSKAQALKHPNWSMGAKITIDSASMMNKGLEVIEAGRLFNLPADRIEVVVHPESIIHSLVEFCDGSLKAQLGLPDMRLPIQYALTWPERASNPWPRFSFSQYPTLHFEAPNNAVFRALPLAFQALETGGTFPCILNAANEIAVQGFLEEKISFLQMYDCIEFALHKVACVQAPDLTTLIETDAEARRRAAEYIA